MALMRDLAEPRQPQQPQSRALPPHELLAAVKDSKALSRFGGGQQQDAQEFLRGLVVRPGSNLAVPGCARLHRAVPGCTGLCQVVPGCARLYRAVPGCTRLYLAVPGCTWLYRVVPGCTGLYRAVRGCTGLHRAVPGLQCWKPAGATASAQPTSDYIVNIVHAVRRKYEP